MIYIRYKDNWADEMDIEGAMLVDKNYFDLLMEVVELFFIIENKRMEYLKSKNEEKYAYRYDVEIEFYIGTNEAVGFYSFEGFKDCLTIKETSKTEEGFLKRFQLNNFGITGPINLYSWCDQLYDFLENYIDEERDYLSEELLNKIKEVLKED